MRSGSHVAARVVAVTLAVGCSESPDARLEANKELVRRFTEATNAADWAALDEIVAEGFRRHSAATAGPPVTSRQRFIALQREFLASFPDQRVTLEQLVAEGDRVAALATYSGTQTGPMGDLPATGKVVEAPFLALFRIESGEIVELWVEWDNVAMLQQLGLFPPSPAPAGRIETGQAERVDFATRYAAAWSGGDPEALASFYADGGSLTVNAGTPSVGRAAIAATAREYMTAFPDMVVTMDSVSGEGDRATFHWTWTGTHTGPGGTGRSVRISGHEEWTFAADGTIAESRGHFDEAEYRRQLDGPPDERP